MQVTVAFSPRAGEVWEAELSLATQATVLDALQASGVLQRFTQIDLATARLGVWGKTCDPGRLLRERDRVEIYRPLSVDPKEARRLRYRAHRERYK
jgi:putative ubiquitin-RnfH superfamily antitoxin RatB of RatAB toxin-antitoxin module